MGKFICPMILIDILHASSGTAKYAIEDLEKQLRDYLGNYPKDRIVSISHSMVYDSENQEFTATAIVVTTNEV